MSVPSLALMRLSALGVSVSAPTAAGVLASAQDSNPWTVGTAVGAVFAFAGLLVQQVIRNQRAVWAIVRSTEEDNHRLRWEIDRYRHRLGEGDDPGPYTPTKETRR